MIDTVVDVGCCGWLAGCYGGSEQYSWCAVVWLQRVNEWSGSSSLGWAVLVGVAMYAGCVTGTQPALQHEIAHTLPQLLSH